MPADSVDQSQITFQAVRPADYPAPYDTMLANNIQFSALDRKAGRLSSIMVRLERGGRGGRASGVYCMSYAQGCLGGWWWCVLFVVVCMCVPGGGGGGGGGYYCEGMVGFVS